MKYAAALSEIQTERRTVGFDTYDITIKQLVDMVAEGAIHISPDYQRRFVWDDVRQSQLIESIYLGIPVPNLFMATNQDSTWDVIDGLQRITTILRFVAPELSSIEGEVVRHLKLKGMEKTPSLNGALFDELPSNLRLNFMTRPMRITVLNDNSDHQVRFDLFERLNTGGIVLHEQEIRNCVYQSPFNDFLKKCAQNEDFLSVIKRKDKSGRGNVEELALKFFAYFEDRNSFKHSVKNFLNEYMEKKSKNFSNSDELKFVFDSTFSAIKKALPKGIVRSNRLNSTPLVLFEAIAVGTADLLSGGNELDSSKLQALLDDTDLKTLTTGATNSPPKLNARIDFVKLNAKK